MYLFYNSINDNNDILSICWVLLSVNARYNMPYEWGSKLGNPG